MKIRFRKELKDKFFLEAVLKNDSIRYQKDIASHIGIHEKTLSRILNGSHYVSAHTAKLLLNLIREDNFDVYFIIE